jgi:hypothetical protein
MIRSMRFRGIIGLWALATLALAGCGDDGGAAGSGSGGGSTTAATGTGGGLQQPTEQTQGPPLHVVGGFSVALPAQTLQPGDETHPCFIAPLVLDGPSRVVGGASVTVGPGMHHGNVTARPRKEGSTDELRPCPEDEEGLPGEAGDVIAGGAVLFGSTTQFEGTEWRTFPDGMGFPIGSDWEIVFRMHYLNTAPEPVTIEPTYAWSTIDEAKVTQLLAPFIWTYSGFEIAPRSEHTVGADCALPVATKFVSLMPHMHKLGTHFGASVIGGAHDGETFLDSPGYNPDGVIVGFDPPLDLTGAAGFHFECTWSNTFDKPIVEGVGDNEMCMLFGYGFPFEASMTAYAVGDNCAMISTPLPEGWD